MVDQIGSALNSMNPAHRAFLAIILAVIFKTMLANWWCRFKALEAQKPVPMRLRGGVYSPWGIVQRIENIGLWILRIWAVWMATMLVMLAYMKYMGWPSLL